MAFLSLSTIRCVGSPILNSATFYGNCWELASLFNFKYPSASGRHTGDQSSVPEMSHCVCGMLRGGACSSIQKNAAITFIADTANSCRVSCLPSYRFYISPHLTYSSCFQSQNSWAGALPGQQHTWACA